MDQHDAWGDVLADSGSGFQPFGFAGGLTDGATGLVRFGVRDYDPTIGRWTAQDPVGFGGGSSGLHAYAGNDPVNLIDRTGRAPQGTENLGRGWTARVDPFEYGGRSSFEIHVFGPTGEVGVYGPAGWIPKHGGVPTGEVPGVVMNRLNGLTVAELRARGLLGPKGRRTSAATATKHGFAAPAVHLARQDSSLMLPTSQRQLRRRRATEPAPSTSWVAACFPSGTSLSMGGLGAKKVNGGAMRFLTRDGTPGELRAQGALLGLPGECQASATRRGQGIRMCGVALQPR
ncbi:MAG: RHS repeat-associated core domain-containing protein [Gemmatimonadetes bacterium]|nr:RHS repeat-associated core domain-containing protein [Gemmatimonadota bacterium]